MSRKVYPTGVGDEKWEFVTPRLTLLREDAAQRLHTLRELFESGALDGRSGLSLTDAKCSLDETMLCEAEG